MLYRIRKDVPATGWLLPEAKWYHHKITFTDHVDDAAELTAEQCATYLALPGMPATAFQEEIPE